MEATHGTPRGYEFSPEQNRVMQTTGRRVRIWAIFTLCGAGLVVLSAVMVLLEGGTLGVVGGLIYGLLALIPIYIGLNFLRAGRALGAVVTTEGTDIDHVMRAVETLGTAFLIQIVAAAVWIALALLAVIAAIAIPSFVGA